MFIHPTFFGGLPSASCDCVRAELSLNTSAYIHGVLDEPLSRSGNCKLEFWGESWNPVKGPIQIIIRFHS